jgi:hypothetical protein
MAEKVKTEEERKLVEFLESSRIDVEKFVEEKRALMQRKRVLDARMEALGIPFSVTPAQVE